MKVKPITENMSSTARCEVTNIKNWQV
jgi:hypothetical protein